MKRKPAITVLMPAYNAARYIGAAIRSVLAQTFTDFELLVINDGSADDTEALVQRFTDERIRLINQPHQGVAAALNLGLLNANAPLIARFDADDICYPFRLQQQYDFLQKHEDYVLIGSDVDYVDQHGEFLYHYSNTGHTHEEIVERIQSGCPFIHSSVMYRKQVALELGGYEAKAHTFEDYHLWIRLIRKGNVYNSPAPMILVRLNPESVTVDERLRGRRFAELKKQMLFDDPITEEQEAELLSILQRQNFLRFKQYSYNILIAKKYLWNNYQPQKARRSLGKAIYGKPLRATGYGLWLLSFLPKPAVDRFYSTFKTIGG